MLKEEHVNSAKSYILGVSAIALPPITTMTSALQFLTMLGGLILVIMRILYDYMEHKKKNGGS